MTSEKASKTLKQLKTKLRVRPAKRKDRQGIKEVNEKCLPVHYDLESWEAMIAMKNSFVLESSGLVVGYLICDDKGVIITFAINEEFRGKGWGRKMLTECIVHMRTKKINKLELRAKVSNTSAVKLYESVGFKIVEKLEKYYTDGKELEDGYLMHFTFG